MARLLTDTQISDETAFREFMAPVLSATDLEELRLNRLRELRAVVESLRRERGQASFDTRADQDYYSANMSSTAPSPAFQRRHY